MDASCSLGSVSTAVAVTVPAARPDLAPLSCLRFRTASCNAPGGREASSVSAGASTSPSDSSAACAPGMRATESLLRSTSRSVCVDDAWSTPMLRRSCRRKLRCS
eukprot:6186477-Pleurochrysis_carterae.AAC.5